MNADSGKLDLDELVSADEPSADDIELEIDPALLADDAGFQDVSADHQSESLGAIYNVPVQVSAVLGKTSMPINQLIRLGRGAVLELDRKVGESIDVVVNNRLVARGEVVIVDERIGITMTEIIKSDD